MRILVAGGAGYIGSHVVKALCNRGDSVVVADNLVTGHRQAVDRRAKFYQGDIRDHGFLSALFQAEPVDGVIHFAAYSLVGESVTAPLKYYENNVGGTRVLLEEMIRAGVKKIVFSSSAAVYGQPEQVPIEETAPTCPTNPYGETKRVMEQMFRWAEQAYGVGFVSLRYFNACGAEEGGAIGEDHRPESHLIPLVLQVPLGKRAKVSIFGTDYPTKDGTCVRDYIHVTDLAQAHLLAMDYLAQGGKSDIFNLGNGVGFSVREVIETARRVTGHPIDEEESGRRAGDPAVLVASSQKARAVLGWTPCHTALDDIIASAWAWHQAHPNGFEEEGRS